MAFVFAYLGDGPMWSRTDIAKRCENNWPENLFFVKKFKKKKKFFLIFRYKIC
jgi:hypothetical protein